MKYNTTHLHLAPGLDAPLRHLTKHMLITGASGTGKSTTAGAVVERLSDHGIPVIVLDAKGDLESLTTGEVINPDGETVPRAGSVVCPYGERGKRRRLHVGAMGGDLVARALELSEAQTGALNIALYWAQDQGQEVASLDDLRRTLAHVVEIRESLFADYGLVTPGSVAAIQRAVLPLDRAAGDAFGAPAFDPFDHTDIGEVTVINCGQLSETQGAYGALCAWIVDSLYRGAPEVGNVSRPRLAVLIDESHLIFDGATPAVVRRMEQAARLIRSRGIMLIFATQSPADLPDAISAQLLTRIQHGLRGSTPRQMRGIRAAAESMPAEPGRDLQREIMGLGVGEAVCSVPDDHGAPGIARRVRMSPGKIRLRPLDDDELTLDPEPGPISLASVSAPGPISLAYGGTPEPVRPGPPKRASDEWVTMGRQRGRFHVSEITPTKEWPAPPWWMYAIVWGFIALMFV